MTIEIVDQFGFTLAQDFEPRQSGDPVVAPTSLLDDAGADLAILLAPLSIGAALGRDTGILSGGQDSSAIFAALGTRTGGGSPLDAQTPGLVKYLDRPPVPEVVGGQIFCQASGGTLPYTFLWSLVSGVNCMTGALNTDGVFVAYLSAPSPGNQAAIKCTVHDATSAVASSTTLVSFYYLDLGR